MAKGDLLTGLVVVFSLLSALVCSGGLAQTPAPSLPSSCLVAESRLLIDAGATGRSAGPDLISVDPATGVRIPIPVVEPRRIVALSWSGMAIVEDADDRWALVTATGSVAVPVPGVAVSGILLGQRLVAPPPRWVIERHSTAAAASFRMIDGSTDVVVLEASFQRRIELAASASSPDGRVFVHVQANNVASEVFIFDALTLDQRTFEIPHDARLAAFAISLTFSPDASCLAISMQREGDPSAGTWIIDLAAKSPTPEPVALGYVLAWLPIAE